MDLMEMHQYRASQPVVHQAPGVHRHQLPQMRIFNACKRQGFPVPKGKNSCKKQTKQQTAATKLNLKKKPPKLLGCVSRDAIRNSREKKPRR